MTKLNDQIAQYRKELEAHLPENTERAQGLYNLAESLRKRFKETNDVANLDEAIALHRSAMNLRSAGHPNRHHSLFWLAWCLRQRYRKQGTLPDLEDAITLERAALDLRPEGHPNRFNSLHNLAVSFNDRYIKQVSIADLQETIRLYRAALELRPPGHSGRALALNNLASNLRLRFLELGANDDIEEAILLHQSALDLCPKGHPLEWHGPTELVVSLCDRYDKQGSVGELEEAITLGRAVLELPHPGYLHRGRPFIGLGNALRRRFLKLGVNTDLEEAISLNQSALNLRPAGHPHRSDSLHSLALCFSNRYDKQASIADLEEAIALGRAALELRSPSHCDRAATLYNLADDLRRRFLTLGANADLDEAISLHHSALDLRPVGHPNRLSSLDQLASCLSLRFTKSEAPVDLHTCITLRRVALGLRKPGDPGHATCFRHLVADLKSMLRKLEGPSEIPDSSDHTTFLHDLVTCVGDVIREDHISTTDVDEIVTVARAALRLCPLGHPERTASLTTLAICLQHKFQHRGDVTDLNGAITLHKEVLESYPSALLHELAWCLSQRFAKLSTKLDLDDAIKFEQVASMLYPPGHPDRTESLNSLATYQQLRVKWGGAVPPSDCPSTGSPTEKLISNIVSEVLKPFPPRLLDTYSGTLCDRVSQVLHFKSSEEYRQLMSSVSALDPPLQAAHIWTVVSAYFRYVTLSHRWGNSEPLLCDIEGRVIYDLDPSGGLSKLQSFCLASCEREYSWAWSDTCCIDKENSAELQEAIGSMFSWYQQSVLTMVYLADVSETDTLTSSDWFKRGWTLQELLAPRSLLFFTRDWSLYRDISSNHKEDSTILGELEQATGIASRHLTDFYPSADNARLRLQWASTRFTTRPEDVSYSLFGVFGLRLPVLYGESAESALGRLLGEVISRSGDASILDWVGQSSTFHSCFPTTIVPYRTLFSQPPSLDLTASPNIGWIQTFLNLGSVRKMHEALSRLPLTQILNFRLILPCIVHPIKTIGLTRLATNTTALVYRIQAAGLEPIEIALSQPLENISGTEVPYVLIRPWSSNLLDASVLSDSASARRWLMRMQQPFSALLLKELPQNEHRRVASFFHILARPTDSTGVLKAKVTTLTVV